MGVGWASAHQSHHSTNSTISTTSRFLANRRVLVFGSYSVETAEITGLADSVGLVWVGGI
ncbi:TPA: hypothetical protein ACFRHE_002267 [Neisseria lactamica]